MRAWAPIVTLLVVAGCSMASFDQLVPKAEAVAGREVFTHLQRRDFESVERMLSPQVTAGGPVRPALERVSAFFPSDAPTSVRVVGAFTNTVNGTRRVTLTYEYEYPRQWLLASVDFLPTPDGLFIEGLRVVPTADSQERLSAFTLRGKSVTHWAMLAWTAFVPVFVIAVFVLLLRTPVPRRKWLWIVAVLLGVGRVSFNWATGEIRLEPFQLLVLGAAWFKPSFGPLILSASVPIGALVFLWKRRRWRASPPRMQTGAGLPVDA